MIFYTAGIPGGHLLEYRQWPPYRAFRAVNCRFWLPRPAVRVAQWFAIQRRIDGGPWAFVTLPPFLRGVRP